MRLERWARAVRGTIGSTIVLSPLVAVAMASLAHLALYFDGAKLTVLAFFNIVVETLVVAVPLILYSRRVISQLEKSRTQLSHHVAAPGLRGGRGRAGQPRQILLPGQYEP